MRRSRPPAMRRIRDRRTTRPARFARAAAVVCWATAVLSTRSGTTARSAPSAGTAAGSGAVVVGVEAGSDGTVVVTGSATGSRATASTRPTVISDNPSSEHESAKTNRRMQIPPRTVSTGPYRRELNATEGRSELRLNARGTVGRGPRPGGPLSRNDRGCSRRSGRPGGRRTPGSSRRPPRCGPAALSSTRKNAHWSETRAACCMLCVTITIVTCCTSSRDRLLDDPGGHRVEGRAGLVHEQHVGLDREGPGDAQPLLLTAGERAARVEAGLDLFPQARASQTRLHQLLLVTGRLRARELEPGEHVLRDRHRRERVRLLEHHPDLEPRLGHAQLGSVDVDAVEEHLPAQRGAGHQLVHPVQGPEEGRLPTPGRTDERGDLVGPHRERDALEHLVRTEPHAHGVGHEPGAPPGRRRRVDVRHLAAHGGRFFGPEPELGVAGLAGEDVEVHRSAFLRPRPRMRARVKSRSTSITRTSAPVHARDLRRVRAADQLQDEEGQVVLVHVEDIPVQRRGTEHGEHHGRGLADRAGGPRIAAEIRPRAGGGQHHPQHGLPLRQHRARATPRGGCRERSAASPRRLG